MAWNCWGLGNALAVRGLLRCHKAEEADVLFLSETKLDERRMQEFKKKLGMAHMEVVDCVGKEGNCCIMEGWDQCDFAEQIQKSC